MREMLWSIELKHKEVDREADINSDMKAFIDNLTEGEVDDEGI